jgi:hypothetical protein
LPTAEQLEEAIRGAIATAPQLVDDAAWLWTDAYWPPGKNPDRPTRVPMRRNESGDPDHVDGERLALGIGRDDVRAAYTRSAELVVQAHRLAGRALAHYSGRTFTGGYRRPPRGHDYRVIADDTARRLRKLTDLGVTDDPDSPAARDAWAAAVTLVEAHGSLRKVLRDPGPTDAAPGDRRCQNPNGCPNEARPGGKECPACNRYRLRNHKHRVPRKFAGEYAAKARRSERGEDYAENPLPGYRYVDGVLERSTPHPEKEAS